MRIGLDVTAVTDSQMIQMSAALVEEGMLVIAISLSGTTREIEESICIAKSRNAKVIFITANPAPETATRCDEVLRVAYHEKSGYRYENFTTVFYSGYDRYSVFVLFCE